MDGPTGYHRRAPLNQREKIPRAEAGPVAQYRASICLSLQPTAASSLLSCSALSVVTPPLTSLSMYGSVAKSSKRAIPAGISNCSEISETLAPQQGIVVLNSRIGVARATIASTKLRYQSWARSVPSKGVTATRLPQDEHKTASPY